MKKSRFTDQQIAFTLQQAEGGTPIEEVCRKMSISQATFFGWKKVYGRLQFLTVCGLTTNTIFVLAARDASWSHQSCKPFTMGSASR